MKSFSDLFVLTEGSFAITVQVRYDGFNTCSRGLRYLPPVPVQGLDPMGRLVMIMIWVC